MTPKYYRTGAHTKYDIKAHIVWIPKYRKKILKGSFALRVRDILKQIALQHEVVILSGKVASDHVHLFISYPTTYPLSKLIQYLKGGSSLRLMKEFPHIKQQLYGDNLWARGYFAVSSGTITDEVIREYIDSQEGEQIVEDSQFSIDHM